MNITAAQVKELRQSTGIGMMECKKALVENGGDMDKAIIWLRERGMSRAAKKAGRTAAEGAVSFAINADENQAVIVEVNCETDFAAKNEDFKAFVAKVTTHCLSHNIASIEALNQSDMGGQSIETVLTDLIAKVGENIKVRRIETLAVENGTIIGYSHMGGKIGTLVALQGEKSEKMKDIGNDLAMHIAASSPKYLNRDQVPAQTLEQEKELAAKKLAEQGKPADIIEKIMIGQMNKFYSEICFVDQPFVKEPKLSVEKFVKQSGTNAAIVGFSRFQLGEGIEVEKTNFSDEVKAQLNQ